jgi:Arc/MetJ family transcription regulator
MRTTITLDADVESLLRQAMRERGLSFKEAVNEGLRAGLSPRARGRFQQRAFDLGFRPDVNYDKALEIAAAIEVQELLHKQALGK